MKVYLKANPDCPTECPEYVVDFLSAGGCVADSWDCPCWGEKKRAAYKEAHPELFPEKEEEV